MDEIIKRSKSIIPACDFSSLKELQEIVEKTCQIEGIGGYKVGFELVISNGLPAVVESIKKLTDLPIIYDHQKGATDIPDIGGKFAQVCKKAKVDAVILFPLVGPATGRTWIAACQEQKLKVIVGGEMTHQMFKISEGGYMTDQGVEEIYTNAAKQGIRDFVVPGNRVDRIKVYREMLKDINPVFYSPGLIAQGGEITEAARVAGERWHAIVGRALYQAKDITATAKELTKDLI
ncbi:MAG: orotidine 5'-phosphate decarboxylase [Candidatus Altiarchaeota archaeon]|nr:orotidine 5'-phosphate decarboxylase [Candidatus Altiarchaeota archaeon]